MQEDKYLQKNFTDNPLDISMDRRDFLKVTGGGIFILFALWDAEALAQARGRIPTDFNAFLRIGEDGRVTCFTGKIEMGQGIITSLAMELADELDVPLDRVDMVMGDTDLCPWDRGTFGSLSTRSFGPHLRAAGAEGRRVLLELAAKSLNVPVENLVTQDGTVYDKRNKNKQITYARLAQGKKIERHIGTEVSVKDPSEFKIMHTSVLRRDAKEKVTGQAKYAADIQLPGMLYAKVVRPPSHAATLKSIDVSGAKQVPSAQVVRDGDLIAVLHKYPDVAEAARAKIKTSYDVPDSELNETTIFDHLLKVAPDGNVVTEGGDLNAGAADA
ncbi:MAG TPA: molybdopterin cofactor-binding domain-containing protein, partial [bacterium]|nr:molybdopterin cofactor-binding domain-containing protein [bacterium]